MNENSEIGFELQYVWETETGEDKVSPTKRRKYRKVKKKPFITIASFLVAGVEQLILSRKTQEALSCTVGNVVTSETPWTRVLTETIKNSITSDPNSEFIKLKKKVNKYPNEKILVIYVPNEETEEENFYICLTDESDRDVSRMIDQMIAEREACLTNIVSKTARPWKTYGSGIEIFHITNRNNRPLLEVEMQTAYPILKLPTRFRLRLVTDTRDGYLEVLSHRSKFDNTIRKTMDSFIQSSPSMSTVSCQTTYYYPKHVTTQYQFAFEKPQMTKRLIKRLKFFAEHSINHVYEPIYINGYFNFYTNDYKNLIKKNWSSTTTNLANVEEFSSFYNHTLNKEKVISAVCWHPMWSGTAAIAYSMEARNTYKKFRSKVDEVLNAVFDVNPVLLWSFEDKLIPSLVLETPRDITALSFCPYNENLLIGGSINGQIVMWDLSNRLKRSEEQEVLTSEQWIYRKSMQSIMKWMKNTFDPKVVRPVVVSNLGHSHKAAVTQISWVSPYNEITRTGKFRSIPEEENRNSLQFTTLSLDGSIQVWNLKGKPPLDTIKRRKVTGRLKTQPEGLLTDVSPFKPFNRILKPIFKANIVVPNTLRPLPLAIAGRQNVPVLYLEKENEKFTSRKYYSNVLGRSSKILENFYVLGSTEGDVVEASWYGYDFHSSESVTKEESKISYFVKFHDGVIVSLALCPERNDFILSVGGKIFALWHLDYPNKPIMWKRSKYRYTHGEWCDFRHSVFFLCRSDGCIEIWNFSMRYDRCQYVKQLSGGSLAGLYLHKLPLQREVAGICDYTQALRLFYIDQDQTIDYAKENKKFQELLDRELEKKRILEKWNQQWNKRNALIIEVKHQKLLETLKKKEEEKTVKIEKEETKTHKQITKDDWKMKEIKRMSTTLLKKVE